MYPFLNNVLNSFNQQDLFQIAKVLGVGHKNTPKPELMNYLENYVTHNLIHVIDHLSEAEKLYIADLVHNGVSSPIAFTAKYKKKCPYLPHYFHRYKLNLSPFHLLVSDLGSYKTVSVPGELKEPLRSLLPKPVIIQIETTRELPAVLTLPGSSISRARERPIHVFEGERYVFPEIRRMLSLAQAGKIQVTPKTKKPSNTAVRTIADALMLPDFDLEQPIEENTFFYSATCGPVRGYAWGVLLQQLGWCNCRQEKLILSKTGKEFTASPNAESYRHGIDRLIHNDDFDEMNRINNIRGQTGKNALYVINPSDRKKTICQAIAGWPIGEWLSFHEALRSVYATTQGFNVVLEGYHFFFTEHQYGSLGGNEFGINAQYLRAFLFETLATLGLIDVAYVYPHYLWPEFGDSWGIDDLDFCGRYDGLLFVRLNPLGAYGLKVTNHYELPASDEPRTLTILPNHEIVCVEEKESNSPDRHFLKLIANPKGEYHWTLEKKRILDYLESGGTISEISDFLERRSKTGIPNTVDVFMKDIDEKTGLFEKPVEAVLVEVKDPSAAALIANSRYTKKLCYLAGDHHLAVLKKNLRAFRAALKKEGYIFS